MNRDKIINNNVFNGNSKKNIIGDLYNSVDYLPYN